MTPTLALMLVAMVCWGSWTNTWRMTRGWRLELYHADYSLGVLAAALLASALDPGAVLANLREADASAIAWTVLGGAALNAGNFLLMAGIARVGMTIAFPVSVGFALVVSTILSYVVKPQGDPLLLSAGVALVFGAVVTNAAAYGSTGSVRANRGAAGLIMCFAAGVLFSICGPLVAKALTSPRPVSALAASVLYGSGSLVASWALIAYLAKHPVDGGRFDAEDYARGGWRNHAAGLLGGLVWGTGMVTSFAAAAVAGMAVAGAVGQANPLVAALWGLVVWREFRGASQRTHALLALMLVLYGAGLWLLAGSAN